MTDTSFFYFLIQWKANQIKTFRKIAKMELVNAYHIFQCKFQKD